MNKVKNEKIKNILKIYLPFFQRLFTKKTYDMDKI